MSGAPAPPRLARWLLERALPPDARENISGDLEELFRRRCASGGLWRARAWYCRETALFSGRFAWERLVERRPPARELAERTASGRAGGGGGGPMAARMSWLDVKLGLRMLVKYPGLSLVGGVGMATAIAIGAVFAAMAAVYYADLPLADGDRVVAIEDWDTEVNNQERRILHDFVTWREDLTSVVELGAYRTIERNLIPAHGAAQPIRIAEMTASGFQLARVFPLMGRYVIAADEREGAPPVVVIGYDVWQTRFAGDPDIIGQTVRLGNTAHTVVGVMPPGFAFPVNHGVWVPFREKPSDYAQREGPGIYVFGRLAPGVTLDQAQAEVTTIGQRLAAAFPETHARLRPRVVPYTLQSFDNAESGMIPVAQLLVILLLVEICVNVAILVYARTATRQGEIAVRSALGASRRRIVAQLFVEALVLAGISAVVGLVVAGLSLRQLRFIFTQFTPGGLPFWMDIGLSTSTVLYVLTLTVLAAAITGIVPAIKATGRRVQVALQHLSAGGTGMRFGRSWTVLVVAQVVVAVAILPVAVYYARTYIQYGTANPGFAGGELDDVLTASLRMDRDPAKAKAEPYEREFGPRYREREAELVRRLEAEPGVSAVTFAQRPPGEEPTNRLEADTARAPRAVASGNTTRAGAAAHRVGIGRVAAGFFSALDVPILMGRRFNTGDLGAASNAVIVNESFVREVLGGGNALGRRVRYVSGYRSGGVMRTVAGMELGRWYEIVGVVHDPPNVMDPDRPRAKLYRPMAPGEAYPSTLVVRVRGRAPANFTARLREITAALDPALQVDDIRPLNDVLRQAQGAMRLTALALTLVTLSILLLSSAGVYALMSFTVAQRRREIAIRSALGADPRRILANIFSRALGQLAIGVVVGGLAAPLLLVVDTPMDREKAVVLVTVSLLMLAVGLLAAVGPARRGLRIQPTEALKEG